MFLSLIGLGVAGELFYEQHFGSGKGTVCDVNQVVSCSTVLTSKYSELFNVSLSVFGLIWFFVLFLLTLKSFKNLKLIYGVLCWQVLGILFVFYLVAAEIILKTLCLLCTVEHLIVIISLILALIIYKKEQIKLESKEKIRLFRPWAVWVSLLMSLVIIYFNYGI